MYRETYIHKNNVIVQIFYKEYYFYVMMYMLH